MTERVFERGNQHHGPPRRRLCGDTVTGAPVTPIDPNHHSMVHQ